MKLLKSLLLSISVLLSSSYAAASSAPVSTFETAFSEHFAALTRTATQAVAEINRLQEERNTTVRTLLDMFQTEFSANAPGLSDRNDVMSILTAVHTQIKALAHKNAELTAELSTTKQENAAAVAALNSELASQQSALIATQIELSSVKGQLETAQSEKAAVEGEMSAYRDQVYAETREHYNEQILEIEMEKRRQFFELNAKRIEVEALKARVAELEHEPARLQAEHGQIIPDLQARFAEKETAMQQLHAQLEAQIAEKDDAIRRLEGQLVELNKSFSEGQTRLKSLDDEIFSAKATIAALETALSEAQAKGRAMESNLEGLRSQTAEKDNRIRGLESEIETLQQSIDRLQRESEIQLKVLDAANS